MKWGLPVKAARSTGSSAKSFRATRYATPATPERRDMPPLSDEICDASTSGSEDESFSYSSEPVWADCECAWHHLLKSKVSHQAPPMFFEHLHMAHDGGIGLITGTKDRATDSLWSRSRYFGTALTLVSCVANTFYIFHLCDKVIHTPVGDELYEKNDYLIIKNLLNGASTLAGRELLLELAAFKVLSVLEVIMVTYLWLYLLHSIWIIYRRPGWSRWQAVQSVFFEQLGVLSVFSAMQLLFFVTPKVFMSNLRTVLFMVENPDYCKAFRMISFALFCFIVGFDAFLVKFRQAALHFIVGKDELTSINFYGAAMFLNQILGVVQLEWVVRRRVFRFVFKGPSDKFSDEALVKMDVWNAWAARTIWERYARVVDRIAMLTTFSDDDFQAMVLSDSIEV